jgi:uncharacterized integral membrane protein
MQNKIYLFLAFVGLMLLAVFLRIYHIDHFSLFGDEKQSVLIGVANTNIGGMSQVLLEGHTFTPADFWRDRGILSFLDADARGDVSGNSLVHDLMLKLFANLFGRTDAVFRSVSVFFNILTLWLLFYWYRKIYPGPRQWQIFVLLLAVVEPFFVIYSQQARNYTTSIFFSTLSNYYFWMLVMRGETPYKQKHIVGWVIASTCAMFSTYLTAMVLIGQAIYLTINFPTKKVYLRMLLGGIVAIIPLVLWVLFGPGKHFLGYQADAASKYLAYLKSNGPIQGWIEPSTFVNITKRTIAILSDQFLWTNDIYNKKGFQFGGVVLLLFAAGIYSWLKNAKPNVKGFYTFCLIQILLPILILILAAINAGTTTGYFIRYASFSLPLGIFVSVGYLRFLYTKSIWIRIIASLHLLIQIYFQVEIFRALYDDAPQKYTFSHDRLPNPYPVIASKIVSSYRTGDTIVYPSVQNVAFTNQKPEEKNYNTSDAQLVNLYLPQKAQYIQRIDKNMQDSVIIRGIRGRKILLFDFAKHPIRY